MPDCRYCGSSGWLFALDASGLCGSCQHLVSAEIEQCARVFERSARDAASTQNTETKLDRLNLAVVQLEALARYERKGIPTPVSSPERLLREAQKERDALAMRAAKEDLDATMKALHGEPDKELKAKRLNELRLRLLGYAEKTGSKGPLPLLEKKVRAAAWRARLSAALERARSADQAGKVPEAVKAYREAATLLAAPEASGPVLIDQRLKVSDRLCALGQGS